MGRTATPPPQKHDLVAYVLPVVGIVLGFVVLRGPIDARMIVGTALIGGVALVNGRYGRQLIFARRRPKEGSAAAA